MPELFLCSLLTYLFFTPYHPFITNFTRTFQGNSPHDVGTKLPYCDDPSIGRHNIGPFFSRGRGGGRRLRNKIINQVSEAESRFHGRPLETTTSTGHVSVVHPDPTAQVWEVN